MEDESKYTDSFVPKFLNEEPVVLMGLTDVELMVAIAFGFIFGGMTSGIFAAYLGAKMFSLIIALFTMALVSYGVMNFIASEKVGKPRGYLKSKIKSKFSRFAPRLFNASQLYLIDEPLTVGRSNKVIVEKEMTNG